MAKMYTIKDNGMEFTAPTQAEAVALAIAYKKGLGEKPTTSRRGDAQPKAEMVNFTKANGEVVQCTQAQANAWAKWRDGAASRVASKEANLAKFEADRKAYKPSQAFVKALKANPTMTRPEAKAYGFVGTSNDLWNLKYGTEGVIRKGTYNR